MWSMEEARLLGRVIEQERGRALAAPVGRAVRPPSARRARMARALRSLAERLDPGNMRNVHSQLGAAAQATSR